jgi:hypothetical protein
MRGKFGGFARAFSRVLTQAQRDLWNLAGPKVQSKARLGSGPLTGQQLFQSLNSARACIGYGGLLLVPTAQVIFNPSPIGRLIATNGEEGVRLLLEVSGPVTEEIMVFGQAPCSAGRSKRRNVAYLGLPPAPQDGMIDITALYVARYGEPRPGEKVFIVTRQQKDGWEGDDQETSEIIPEKPAGQQAASTVALTLQVHMHKGCTRDAQGSSSQAAPEQRASSGPRAPGADAEEARQDKFEPAGTLALPTGPQSAHCGDHALQEGVRVGGTTGDIHIHANDFIHAAAGVVLAQDAARAAADTRGHDQPWFGCGIIAFAPHQFHVP